MFVVSASYPIERLNELQDFFEGIRESKGYQFDSGAGFGLRDVSFYIEDEDEAWEVFSLLQQEGPVSDSFDHYDE
jgi:hypothetical protein